MELAAHILLLAAATLLVTCNAVPIQLNSTADFLDYFTNGATVQYFVNIDNCKLQFPSKLPSYSFSNELQSGLLLIDQPIQTSILNTYLTQEVNGSHYNMTVPARRIITIDFDSQNFQKVEHFAFVRFFDTNASPYKVLLNGTADCPMFADNPGATVFASTAKGTPLTDYDSIKMSMEKGYRLHFSLDRAMCAGQPPLAKYIWAGEVLDMRENKHGALAFTAMVEDETYLTVVDVKLSTDSTSALVHPYHVTKATGEVSSSGDQTCYLNKSLMIFRQ